MFVLCLLKNKPQLGNFIEEGTSTQVAGFVLDWQAWISSAIKRCMRVNAGACRTILTTSAYICNRQWQSER